jgi:hypothetical protein
MEYLPVFLAAAFAGFLLLLWRRDRQIEQMKERARAAQEPRLFTYHANTRPEARESRHGDPEQFEEEAGA